MPTSVYVVHKPAISPIVVEGGVSSAPTVLVLGTEEIVTEAPVPSTFSSETTQLILNTAASLGSSPQDILKTDSGIISNIDSAQVNAFF